MINLPNKISSVRLYSWVCIVLLGVLAVCGANVQRAAAQSRGAIVYVVTIDGTIDLGLTPFVERVLKEAERGKAAAVVFDINTLGGRLDAGIAIRDALLETPLTTVALVRKRAISAGALIAIATTKLAMGDGATLGAATPVVMPPGDITVTADEKTISYVRKEFRATAERRGRPALLAEAMVDSSVEIPGVIEKGKLLTLTTEEALTQKMADFKANDLNSALAHLGLAGAQVRTLSPLWAETFVRFITSPAVASILMTLGLLGIMVELRTPGFGVPGVVGMLCLGLFFWGHWIARLAGLEELLLTVLGVGLLVIEIFVTPGFGLAGVLGIVALGMGLGLSLIGAGTTWNAIVFSFGQALISLVLALVLLVVLLRFLPRLRFMRGIVLDSALASDMPVVENSGPLGSRVGLRGVALTPLRPAGIAEIAGERVDVVSDGPFIVAGAPLEVLREDGNRVVVRLSTLKE